MLQKVLSSKNNKAIKYIRKLLLSRRERENSSIFVIEGLRLCVSAVESNARIEMFFYTNEAKVNNMEKFDLLFNNSINSFEVTQDIMNYISDTINPQGFLCVCKMLDNHISIDKINNAGFYVALENIQDPSNMGNILRTAEALGIDGLIISNNSCDIYNPKVIRGSMGALFRMQFVYIEDFLDLINILSNNGIITYASIPSSNALSINKIDFTDGGILFIGNEANGLTKPLIESCNFKITIPMLGRAESLNAATAANIIMWEMIKSKLA